MSDAIPPVSRDPDIQGGSLCVAGTRVPVRGLRAFRAAGYRAEAIAAEYPSLTADRIREVLAYVDAHPDALCDPAPAIPAAKVEAVARAVMLEDGCGLTIKGRRAMCYDPDAESDHLEPSGGCCCRKSALAAIRAADAWDAAERKRQREADEARGAETRWWAD